jgi:osmotically-inducible protein OsmY
MCRKRSSGNQASTLAVSGWSSSTESSRWRAKVDWDYHRRAAEEAIRNLRGIKGIRNLLTVNPRVQPLRVKQRIEEALRREGIDADRITVEVEGGEVILRGTVRGWAERQQAEEAAWSAPGVHAVYNNLAVEPVEAAA